MYCGVVIHTQSTTTTTTTTTTTVTLLNVPMLAPRSVPAARAFAAAEHELRTAEALDWRSIGVLIFGQFPVWAPC